MFILGGLKSRGFKEKEEKMKVTQKERMILRILGFRCCVTCKHFNSKSNICEYEPYIVLESVFDLRENKWLRKRQKTRVERLISIGSACEYWKGFKLEGGDMK